MKDTFKKRKKRKPVNAWHCRHQDVIQQKIVNSGKIGNCMQITTSCCEEKLLEKENFAEDVTFYKHVLYCESNYSGFCICFTFIAAALRSQRK